MKDTITLYAVKNKETGRYLDIKTNTEKWVKNPLNASLRQERGESFSDDERIVAFKFKLVTK